MRADINTGSSVFCGWRTVSMGVTGITIHISACWSPWNFPGTALWLFYQHKLTDTQLPCWTGEQCQVWHSWIPLCVKMSRDICELKWEAMLALSCQLAERQQGCQLSNICSSTCRSHGGKAAFWPVGEDTNGYFLIMQLHSPAYFLFGKAEKIGTTRSFAY